MFFKSLAVALSFCYVANAAGPVVNLGYASFQGLDPGNGVYEFLGIPYAAPPLGNLRWRAPQDPVNTAGVQNATQVCYGFVLSMANFY